MTSVLLALALLSCGGGDDLTAGGGIGGTGVHSVGEVTAIGSIWVNGVEYDTRQADVFLNNEFIGGGDHVIIENLDVGRIVYVKGRLFSTDQGLAEEVYFTSTVLGPVDAIQFIDDYTMKLTVLDQIVIVNSHTRMKNVVLDDLAEGDTVDISGHYDDTGVIFASFMEETGATIYIVTGTISHLNTVDTTLTINGLAVDYHRAKTSGAVPADMDNGMVASAEGRVEDGRTVFIADRIIPFLNMDEIQGDAVEIEGFVGSAVQDDQFGLNGLIVEVNENTEYTGGAKEEMLPGVVVEVEGAVTGGVVLAEKVKFSPLFRAESDLEQKDSIDVTLELTEMEEITIQTNSLTRYLGLSEDFDALSPGDHLVIKGSIVEDQVVMAVQVIGRPAVQDGIVLSGTTTTISNPLLFINGGTIDTGAIPANGFYADDDTAISREVFWQLLHEDDWVEARGTLAGGSAVWEKVTLGPIE
jgi:hypothetical protein